MHENEPAPEVLNLGCNACPELCVRYLTLRSVPSTDSIARQFTESEILIREDLGQKLSEAERQAILVDNLDNMRTDFEQDTFEIESNPCSGPITERRFRIPGTNLRFGRMVIRCTNSAVSKAERRRTFFRA